MQQNNAVRGENWYARGPLLCCKGVKRSGGSSLHWLGVW